MDVSQTYSTTGVMSVLSSSSTFRASAALTTTVSRIIMLMAQCRHLATTLEIKKSNLSIAMCFIFTVEGETGNGSKRRALHVVSLLRQYRQPELWRHVSQHIVKNGKLDVSCVITSAQVHDLVYLLASSAASDVTSLE